jgi:hypothetical protein
VNSLPLRQFKTVSKQLLPGYDAPMNQMTRRLPTIAVAALAAAASAALAATAFAGWLDHGSAIFLSMAESGMAWCF